MFYSRSSDIQFSVYLNNNVRRLWGHTEGDAALKKTKKKSCCYCLLFFNQEFKCIIIFMSLNEPIVLSIEKVY